MNGRNSQPEGLTVGHNKCVHSESSDDGATSPLWVTQEINSEAVAERNVMCVNGGGAESLYERAMETQWAGDGGKGGVATGTPD